MNLNLDAMPEGKDEAVPIPQPILAENHNPLDVWGTTPEPEAEKLVSPGISVTEKDVSETKPDPFEELMMDFLMVLGELFATVAPIPTKQSEWQHIPIDDQASLYVRWTPISELADEAEAQAEVSERQEDTKEEVCPFCGTSECLKEQSDRKKLFSEVVEQLMKKK